MSGFNHSEDNLQSTLKSYTALLEARNNALLQLSQTGAEMHSTLRLSQNADINGILERREQECSYYASLCHNGEASDNALLDAARQAVETANDEMGILAQRVLALREDSKKLAEEIIACQNECEFILKERIASTAKAIRQSVQRRKLDAVYGPACKHGTPAFLDKQQ